MGRNLGGILSTEAGMAEVGGTNHLCQVFDFQIAQGICADDFRNFGNRVVAGNQVLPGINIRAIVAGMRKGGDEIRI